MAVLELRHVEVSVDQALHRDNDVGALAWTALDPGGDKYTAASFLEPTGGFFLRIRADQRVPFPVQACLLLARHDARQA